MSQATDIGIRLVVGLGNPGPRYAGTRHNVGFAVLDAMARREGVEFGPEKRWKCEVARLPGCGTGPVTLLKPMTFMNLSGESVGPAARYQKLAPEQVLVVYDDVALPFGRLRLRAGGSAGGHNGIRSIIATLGTDRFPRVRFGVGMESQDPRVDLSDHVLGRFTEDERAGLENYLDRAVDALSCALANGVEPAMNEFNRAPGSGSRPGAEGRGSASPGSGSGSGGRPPLSPPPGGDRDAGP